MAWITTKTGKRINTDWFDDDEKKQKQINANKSESDVRNKVKKETVKNPEDIIPKDSYSKSAEYKQKEKELMRDATESDNVDDQYLALSKELDKAKDKHISPEDMKSLGKTMARLFVNEHDYPEVAEIADRLRKVTQRKKELDDRISEAHRYFKEQDDKHYKEQKEAYGRPDFKEAHGDYEGFKSNESTTPYVDEKLKEGKAKVVEMTPEQYIHECAHYIFENSTIEKVTRGRLTDRETKEYAKMMRDGVKFDTPYLRYSEYGEGAQEGLHRAVAAYMNGIEKMPVIIIGTRRR